MAGFQRHKRSYYVSDALNSSQSTFLLASTTGTGASVTLLTASSIAPNGSQKLTTGTTATGRASLGTDWSGAFYVMAGGGEKGFRARVWPITNLSDGTNRYIMRVGFVTSSTHAATTDGAYFVYSDNINSGKWLAQTTLASTPTTTDTGITVAANTPAVLAVVLNANGTAQYYYINNVLVATHAVNLQTKTLGLALCMEKTLGTTAREFAVSYHELYIDAIPDLTQGSINATLNDQATYNEYTFVDGTIRKDYESA